MNKRQLWRSPRAFFRALDAIYHFTVDACASAEDHLVPVWWTDCENKDWGGKVVYCNPPFRLAQKILTKGWEAKTAVFVLPMSALFAKYFDKYPCNYICLLSTRAKFTPPEGIIPSSPTYGTFLAIFNPTIEQLEDTEAKIGKVYMPCFRCSEDGPVIPRLLRK